MREMKFKYYFNVDIGTNIFSRIATLKDIENNKAFNGIVGCANNPIRCQFTGLLDKNGVEIYEGDIVKWNYKIVCRIIYHRASFVLSTNQTLCYRELSYKHQDCEIIGNIYENKEISLS